MIQERSGNIAFITETADRKWAVKFNKVIDPGWAFGSMDEAVLFSKKNLGEGCNITIYHVPVKSFNAQRKSDNLELADILLNAINAQPTARFSQLLSNLGLVTEVSKDGIVVGWKDEFYTEPYEILARVKAQAERK